VPVAAAVGGADQRMTELKMEPLLSLPPNADDKKSSNFSTNTTCGCDVIDKENRPSGDHVDDVVSKLVKD